MTSRLLKKHPITAPNVPAAKARSRFGCSLLATVVWCTTAHSMFAEDANTYVTAQASTLDRAVTPEPRFLNLASEPLVTGSKSTVASKPKQLDWRAVRRTSEQNTVTTRLVAHEETIGAPQLIAASQSRGPALIAQVDPLNDNAFDDPFSDNNLNQPEQPRPLDELESDLPEREPLPPFDEPEPSDPGRAEPDPFGDPFGNDRDAELEPMTEEPARPLPTPRSEPRQLPADNGQGTMLDDECARAVHDLRQKRLADIDLAIHFNGIEGRDFPQSCDLDEGDYLGRSWCATQFTWTASGLCHKPLYFEQVNLERYGHSVGPIGQPVLSAAHFFLTVPVLPYKMGVHPTNECIYALGYYRPGDCAPYFIPPIPISARGALFQAGAVVGVVAALP